VLEGEALVDSAGEPAGLPDPGSTVAPPEQAARNSTDTSGTMSQRLGLMRAVGWRAVGWRAFIGPP
jgi:hypothetical protein